MELLEAIYGCHDLGLGEDVLIWGGDVTGNFSVSSFYKLLSSQESDSFSWQSIWVPGVPMKVSFLSGRRL